MRAFELYFKLRLLNDLDSANNGECEGLCLCSSDDSHDGKDGSYYPADKRNAFDNAADDAVVYVISYERTILVRSDEKTEEPEKSDVRKNREKFCV